MNVASVVLVNPETVCAKCCFTREDFVVVVVAAAALPGSFVVGGA